MSEARRLGEILAERVGFDDETLQKALARMEWQPSLRVGESLKQLEAVTEEDIAEALSIQLGVPFFDPLTTEADPAVLWRVSPELAREAGALPLRLLPDGRILVAMSDPTDGAAFERVAAAAGAQLRVAVATPDRIRRALVRHYDTLPPGRRTIEGTPPDLRSLTVSPRSVEIDRGRVERFLKLQGPQAPARLLEFLVLNAVERRAAAIHLDARPDETIVRLRIDGVLREVLRLPARVGTPMVNRAQRLARLNRDPRGPRDEVRLDIGRQRVRLAVAGGARFGEATALRIIEPAPFTPALNQMGWRAEALEAWLSLLSGASGLLLVAGPGDSGRSAIAYASLRRLARGMRSVASVEERIEQPLTGVNQVAAAGAEVAPTLRRLLQQTPDVVHVGEVGDLECARLVARAAARGRLVIAEITAPTAVAAIGQLQALGLQASELAASLRGVVATRLMRGVCPHCSVTSRLKAEDWARANLPEGDPGPRTRRPGPGCPNCQYTGFAGRMGISEILPITQPTADRLRAGQGEPALWEHLRGLGTLTLLDDALIRVRQGLSTLDELRRVIATAQLPAAVLHDAVGRQTPGASLEEVPAEALELLDEVTPAPRAGRPTVLAVDDAPDILVLVSMALEHVFDVRCAGDGLEALELVAEAPPDLIVLDVMMPRMSGYEVCEKLREDPATAGIPVLFLSARSEVDQVKAGFKAGGDDYLPKPFDPEVLELRARAILRRSGWRFDD